MEFTNTTSIKIDELQKELLRLEEQFKAEKAAFVAAKVAEGWKEFRFFSVYYGSHSEYGEGDREKNYLFHPSVDVSRWEGIGFDHGSFSSSDSNYAFGAWLEELPDEQYFELSSE